MQPPCTYDDDLPPRKPRSPIPASMPLGNLLWLSTAVLFAALLLGSITGITAFVAYRTFHVLFSLGM